MTTEVAENNVLLTTKRRYCVVILVTLYKTKTAHIRNACEQFRVQVL